MSSLNVTQLVDALLVFTVLEGFALAIHHHRSGRGVPPREFVANLVSGLCLMLALRCLAADAGSHWVALCLLAAGLAHATDIARRWRRGVPAGAAATRQTTTVPTQRAEQRTAQKVHP